MNISNLKKYLKPIIYGSAAISMLLSLYFIGDAIKKRTKNNDDNLNYVTNSIFDNVVPVINSEKTITRPYVSEDVKVIKSFYDYKSEAESQVGAIVYYENTYIQNSGVDYAGTTNFDVVAIIDGTVTKVADDKLLGKIVEIRHSNDLISVYQSLSEVKVKKDDVITQGQIIGKSGVSSIATDLKDHLHLEVMYKGELINAETIYNKAINKLEG